MPLTLQILTGILTPGLLTSAALIILLFIALIIILLIVPFNLCLFLCKEGQLIQGKLRGSWLGISAGGDLRGNEALIQGSLWVSWLSIKLFNKEITSPSALDLIASITGSEKKEESDEKRNKGWQDESRQGSDRIAGEPEVIEEGDGISMRQIRTVLAAMPVFVDIVRDLFRSFSFKTLRCRLQFGLDDPSETAILSGRLWSVAAFFRYLGADAIIEPFFEEERLEGELLAEARMRPIHILAAIISALRQEEIRLLIKDATGRGF